MRNFMRKLHAEFVTPNLQIWASLCLNSYLFSFCSNDCPQVSLNPTVLVTSTSAFYCARAVVENFCGRDRELAFDGRPSRVCSGALLLLLLAAASTTAALLLLPAVTLHRPAPRRDQARRRPATRPPAPLRVQVQHARPPPVEPAEPFGQGADCRFAEPHARSSCPLARASASRWACTLLAQTTNCGPTFRARARRGAPPRRAAAPEEKIGPGGAWGEADSPRRSTPKCSTGKTFFVGNLAKRVNPVSDHVDHEVISTD